MDALKAATNSSTENVAIGWRSLLAATSGDYNTAVGKRSGDSITTGSYNLMLGKDAGQNLVDGSGNIIIGTADNSVLAILSVTWFLNKNFRLLVANGRVVN